ncbi:nucleotidyltransferase domain-containing protein [Candidatus Woesearchaeota archaeon]|nr:nucleotidyltransferase domain-containing protein [Candidatus Woesearchaeota archaeon]
MQKRLIRSLRDEKRPEIFDIILYGSAFKGKEGRDLDIVVIFKTATLRERLDQIQRIKDNLKASYDNIDIKQTTLEELFSSAFFARTGILTEGISVFRNKPLPEVLGFRSYVLFWYSLDGLTHAQKVKFNYILAGRGSKGMLKELEGERLVNGAIKIPTKDSLKFESILEANKVTYKKKAILEVI